jgi:hypothetical protein
MSEMVGFWYDVIWFDSKAFAQISATVELYYPTTL